jgi:hypothetical protein
VKVTFSIAIVLCFLPINFYSEIKVSNSVSHQGSSLKSTANGELVFNLPMSEAKNFPALFEDLDKNKKNLDFLNLGLSVTTMEDVFLR